MRFLVCYENTSDGTAAVKLAGEYAKRLDARLDVVWAMPRDEPLKHSKLAQLEETLETEARHLLQDSGVAYDTDLLVDDASAGEQIVRFAEHKEPDLIFLGIKKKSRVGKMLFGSNAQYIILHASCPVVTVKSQTQNIVHRI